MPELIKHSKDSNEHYSPLSVLDPTRVVFEGRIDFDPASCKKANLRVQASRICTIEDPAEAFRESWHGNVFMNPPGGVVAGRSNVVLFWDRLIQQWEAGNVVQAIVVAFSMEAFQTTQGCTTPMLAFPFCVARRRICYDITREDAILKQAKRIEKARKAGKLKPAMEKRLVKLEASTDIFVKGDAPPQGSAIIYVPPKPRGKGLEMVDAVFRFKEAFSSLGFVRTDL